MKNSILIIALLICTYIRSNAQTTVEEYNYVTKGYQIQVSSGLDMKKGYSLVDYISQSTSERKIEFKGLMRSGSQKPCAIMMIYTRTGKPAEYLCIPTSDASKELWDSFWSSLVPDVNASNQDKLWLYTYSVAKLASYFAGK